eukprot:TRINITY_DN415_c0_g1_i6.p1 TRINITY_DN415_c0_g1~~TRINITY_DN415_c0_g1_i6.p1  ORF type:complete len:801 (+),score=212.92 TRINITY_DN415_c0_g1_i6:77-2479(+)
MYMQIQRHDDVRVPIVVMDWMMGDSSRAPLSRQKTSPSHYEQVVFPRVREEFRRMSYGKFDIHFTVIPEVVRYTRPRTRYMAEGYPFPGLYNGAKESLAGDAVHGSKYNFDDYDLVYVVAPQQAPVSTKGVAWVGAKGAMCNGCEEISENFQVMVAVHELGHNLGLFHASSESLEYGNVFDWMGNYPDVEGLSYGIGYKLRLRWLPQPSVFNVNDQEVASLNDEFVIRPFDVADPPRQGELVGVQVNLNKNKRDLFISYRGTVGHSKAGIYLTWQDKDKANSELIDAACHSPSQQDARLQPGWTYMDPSNEIVVRVMSIDENRATVRIYKAPSRTDQLAAIRARPTFTDGKYKCPRTCQDSDLLVSMYEGCSTLAKDGYCNGGSITMSGRKLSVKTDLCPQACDACDAVMSGGDGSDGCEDRNIKISGMNCRQAAARGHCNAATSLGNVGTDLCPRSCGQCPAKPAPSSAVSSYKDPTPVRSHGSGIAASEQEEESKPEIPTDSDADVEAEEEKKDEESEPKPDATADPLCTDDLAWTDADNDGCKTYAQFIAEGKLSLEEACGYNDGAAKVHCRKTCGTCQVTTDTCQDKECVSSWMTNFGKCYGCSEYANMCDVDPAFKADCPRTCGTCSAVEPETSMIPLNMEVEDMILNTTTTTTTMPPVTKAPKCEDAACVDAWMKKSGKCYQCGDFAEEFCGRDEEFMKSCPRTCKSCAPHEETVCQDDFKPHVCKRHVMWGECVHSHVAEHCKASCGFCPHTLPTGPAKDKHPAHSGALRRETVGLWALLLAVATAFCATSSR